MIKHVKPLPENTKMAESPSKPRFGHKQTPSPSTLRASTAVPRTQYDEAQEDEITVLESMFMEDFQTIETRAAWSKAADRAFKLRLHAESNNEISVTLSVTLTATYPKTVPMLALEDTGTVDQKTLEKLKSIIATKPKQLVGEVMFTEISEAIREILEDFATAKAADESLPSLEEERVVREAAVARLAQEQQEALLKRQEHEKTEELMARQRMIDEEVKRKEAASESNKKKKKSESTDAVATVSSFPVISFDPPIFYHDEKGNAYSSSSVYVAWGVSSGGPISEIHGAYPTGAQLGTVRLLLKRVKLRRCRVKNSILELEEALEKLKSLRHPNIINVMGFRLVQDKEAWSFDILTEIAVKGSLLEMLRLVDVLPPQKTRPVVLDLLEGLQFYHKEGILHNRIHVGNVLVGQTQNGDLILKLGDAGYQAILYDMLCDNQSLPSSAKRQNSSWPAPELNEDTPAASRTRKSDIWDLGVLVIEMLFGLKITKKFSGPSSFINGVHLSSSMKDLARSIFKHDTRKRPNAVELRAYEFFRSDEGITLDMDPSTLSMLAESPSASNRLRRGSILAPTQASRYADEYVESGRLGKGGFGEVVKARHKLESRTYAIKKIVNKSQRELSKLLTEVQVLATLYHPSVVRYYTSWMEEYDGTRIKGDDESEDASESSSSDSTTGAKEEEDSGSFEPSRGGLDFISSSCYPLIEFAEDSDVSGEGADEKLMDEGDALEEDEGDAREGDEDGEESDDSESSKSLTSQKLDLEASSEDSAVFSAGSSNRKHHEISIPTIKHILYIQMEYCEKLTLKDLIRGGIHKDVDEGWRIFRAVLEGLVHIHASNIIHRDLKPENIFMDSSNNPRIGDFGLARSGQYQLDDRPSSGDNTGSEMTKSVGTTFYVAPELKSTISEEYTDKVDMYSLGIIFFEMCYNLSTGSERVHTLSAIRMERHKLPEEFQDQDKLKQGEVIELLLVHRPKDRPSSRELIKSSKLPLPAEDESLRLALEGLSDMTSPYYARVLSSFFSQSSNRQVEDRMWDIGSGDRKQLKADNMVLQAMAEEKLIACFRRHGAVQVPPPGLMPSSDHYSDRKDTVQLLTRSGTVVQLPHDLTLPQARSLAKHRQTLRKTFTLGTVYREISQSSAPGGRKEVDFDIVSYETKNSALEEAEVIKVIDEVLDALPCFQSMPMCYHLSHSALLEIILEFCRVSVTKRPAAKEVLSRLGSKDCTWHNVRTELRAPGIGLSGTTLDELSRFDFRDTPDKCFAKLETILAGTEYLPRLQSTYVHINSLVEYTKLLGVRRKVWYSPLSNFNAKFYSNEMMFQCVTEDTKMRDVLAAGGRYDQLIKEYDPGTSANGHKKIPHAVGVTIGWDRFLAYMARWQKQGPRKSLSKKVEEVSLKKWAIRRCDVLVASFDTAILHSRGTKIVDLLWSHDISAELADDTNTLEELLARYAEDNHSWIVIVKHDAMATDKPELKIKSLDKHEDHDVRATELINHLRGEMRDRDVREGTNERAKLTRQSSHYTEALTTSGKNRDVQVLNSSRKSKKATRTRVPETAQERTKEMVNSFSDAPIACIDTSDDMLSKINETKLSDPETWRKLDQSVPLSDRQYVQDVCDLLNKFKEKHSETSRYCFLYNSKTGTCVLYDLKL